MTRARIPDPLKLRQHLDAATTTELEEFLRFWSPHEKQTDGRTELVGELERLMSDENVVYAKVDLLSEKVRAVLLQLLKKLHYTCDLQGLFRGIDGLEMEYYEAEAALTALARRGFVRMSRAHEWLHYGRSAYAIPHETALVMRGLAGTDRRPLAHIFVHESFRPSTVEAAGNEAYAPLPKSVGAAIESLPDAPLRTIATHVIERYGGILMRHEFADVFGPRRIRWNSARFLKEFGRRGLGTVGHLDLRTKGIGIDDDALLFFREVVDNYISEWREQPASHDLVLTAHGDLMSDVRTALQQVKEAAVKVAKEGAVYKAARARIAERLQFSRQPLLDRDEVAERVLAIARGLGLAESNGEGRLEITEKGEAWMARPLLDKVADAYDLLREDGTQTLRSRHLRRLHEILVEILTSDAESPQQWWPGASLALVARNRYLLELEKDDSPSHHAPLTISHAALTELGRAAQDRLVRDLFGLGLVDVALRGTEAVGVRLSRLGLRLLRNEPSRPPANPPLVVNPDFELLVLPEGDVDELLHALDRIAVRERTGEVVHYRLDRERIERVAVEGDAADDTIDFLTAHCRAELPQNVVYSIRSWSGNVRLATLERGVLFVANDPTVVEAICNHPELKDCVERVINPTTLFFNGDVMERQIAQELKSLGIHVR
jgi:hypothetical protein